MSDASDPVFQGGAPRWTPTTPAGGWTPPPPPSPPPTPDRYSNGGRYYDSGIAHANTRLGPQGQGVPYGSTTGNYAGYGNVGQASPQELLNQLAVKYPYMMAFINIPEIGNKLREAAAKGWGVDELYGAITQTNWWRTSSASDRAYQVLLAEDPAEAASRAAETAATIQNRARSLGLPMSNEQIMSLARDATRFGWTDEQQVDRLLAAVNWAQVAGGDLTANVDLVKRIGSEYLVRVSDSTARDYAIRIASGELTAEGVQSIMQRQSVGRFGWMSDQITNGVTPRQYLAPVRDEIANELEMAPEEINLMDPQWLGMVEVHDRDSGEMRAATMNEARLAARRDPRWRDTRNAGVTMARAAQGLAAAMGRRAL